MRKSILGLPVALLCLQPFVAPAATNVPFEPARASLLPGDDYPSLRDPALVRLADAVKANQVARDERLLVVQTGRGNRKAVALSVRQLAYFHVAEGTLDGQRWAASFCVVCNSGVAYVPRLDGRDVHLVLAGVYDGTSILRDAETGSLWNHMTLESLHGPLAGRKLPIANLLHTTVESQLALDASTLYAQHADFDALTAGNSLGAVTAQYADAADLKGGSAPTLSKPFQKTIAREDVRLPTMELGLGIRDRGTARFYRYADLRATGGLLLDRFAGRNVVIHIDPTNATPAAFYTQADRLPPPGPANLRRFPEGVALRDGRLEISRSTRIERPIQMFTRWYGFALTFPGTEIAKIAR